MQTISGVATHSIERVEAARDVTYNSAEFRVDNIVLKTPKLSGYKPNVSSGDEVVAVFERKSGEGKLYACYNSTTGVKYFGPGWLVPVSLLLILLGLALTVTIIFAVAGIPVLVFSIVLLLQGIKHRKANKVLASKLNENA